MTDLKETVIHLRDLKANVKKVTCEFIVLEMVQTHKTKDGNEVRTFKVADKTGSMFLTVWDTLGAFLSPADIIRLSGGNTILRGGQLILNVGRYGSMTKIGEYCFLFNENPNYSLSFEDAHAELPANSNKRFAINKI